MTPRSLLCICQLDGKESATPVPVNLDKYGVKFFKRMADRTKGEKNNKLNSGYGITSRMLSVARVCHIVELREDEGFV
jgi:hypothetical protein